MQTVLTQKAELPTEGDLAFFIGIDFPTMEGRAWRQSINNFLN